MMSAKPKIVLMICFSISILKLLGCVILTKLMNAVKRVIHPVWGVKNVYYWTDLKISLYRVKGVNKEWKQGVESRKYLNSVRDISVVNN